MKNLSFLFGLLISGVFLILLFYQINLKQFAIILGSANYLFLFPIILIVYLGCYLRALRWYWLLKPIKEIKSINLFSATIIGYAFNSLLPGRVGEFARAHFIGRVEKISRTSAFATIIVERLFDGLSILTILVIVSLLMPIPGRSALIVAAWSAFTLYLLVIFFILLFVYQKTAALKIFEKLTLFLPENVKQKVLKMFDSLGEGFKTIQSLSVIIMATAYSFLIWIVTAFGIWLNVLAFGQQISPVASMFILVLLTFAVMLPSSPGYLGTFDAGMTWGLMFCGLTKEIALGSTIIYHGINILPIVLLGFYYLWKYNFSLSEA